MRAGWVMSIAVVLGCGGTDPPPPVSPIAMTPVAVKTAPAPKPACIRQPEDAAPIRHATADGDRVSYCVGPAVDQCFVLELETGKLTSLPQPPDAQSQALEASARVETTNPELKVCTETTGCKTLTPQVWPGAAPLRAATNGAVAAVMLGDAEKGRGYVEVYDVMKTRRVAKFRYARGVFKCGDLAMLGDTIYVNATVCNGPSGRAALYSAKGRRLANVGGRGDFGTYGNAYTQIDATLWAFLDENGTRIALQDVTRGKVTKRIDVKALFTEAGGAKLGNPGESAIVRLGDGRLAVIGGTPANGSVAIVDVTSGDVKVVRAPLCN